MDRSSLPKKSVRSVSLTPCIAALRADSPVKPSLIPFVETVDLLQLIEDPNGGLPWILIVEKDVNALLLLHSPMGAMLTPAHRHQAVFTSLCSAGFANKGVLITVGRLKRPPLDLTIPLMTCGVLQGKGFPDLLTRQFTHLLASSFPSYVRKRGIATLLSLISVPLGPPSVRSSMRIQMASKSLQRTSMAVPV